MGKRSSLKTENQMVVQVGGYSAKLLENRLAVRGLTPETRGRKFSLWEMRPGRWRVSWNSTTGKRKRLEFDAQDIISAVKCASDILYGNPSEEDDDILISDVFIRWEKTLTCQQETVDGYNVNVRMFLKWADSKSLRCWNELRLEHIQGYVAELTRAKYARYYIIRRVAPVKQASRWASRNWPEQFRHFTDGLVIQEQAENLGKSKRRRAFLSLPKLSEFLISLYKEEDWNVLPGIALQGLCSLRVMETHRLKWEDVDLEKGIVSVRARKNRFSVRVIPLPAMALEILRQSPRNGDRVLSEFCDWLNYAKSVGKRIRRFAPDLGLEPKGLRRTLPSEAWAGGWYGDALQVYRGHSPDRASAVDWEHYICMDPEGLIELFRTKVVSHIDEATKSYLGQFGQQSGSR